MANLEEATKEDFGKFLKDVQEKPSRLHQAVEALYQIRVTILMLALLLILSGVSYEWYYLQSYQAASETTENLVLTINRVQQQTGDAKSLRLALDEELILNAKHIFFEELALHLAVAFLVAFIVIVSVEISSSLRHRREQKETQKQLAVSVWRAIFQRLTPEAITTELEEIAMAPVIKLECRYTLTFMRPYRDLPDDRVILRRMLHYHLVNVKHRTVADHPIGSIISGEQKNLTVSEIQGDGKEVKHIIPRHMQLAVGEKEIKLDAVLKQDKQGNSRILEHKVTLESGQKPLDVTLLGEEAVRLTGNNAYLQIIPIYGLVVEIFNQCEDKIKILDVQFNHPKKFKPSLVGMSYEYEGGVLPGQSFIVGWVAAQSTSAQTNGEPEGSPGASQKAPNQSLSVDKTLGHESTSSQEPVGPATS